MAVTGGARDAAAVLGHERPDLADELEPVFARHPDVGDEHVQLVVVQRLDRGISATDLIIIPSSTGAVIGIGEPLPGGKRRHAFAFGTLVPSYTSRYVETSLEDAETLLFGSVVEDDKRIYFDIDSAFQGQEGLELVKRALDAKNPYALAFVDVRMPPGWDGIETISRRPVPLKFREIANYVGLALQQPLEPLRRLVNDCGVR